MRLSLLSGIVLLTGSLASGQTTSPDCSCRTGRPGAVLSASGSYGQYGASVGAGAGAFLLVPMLLGRTIQAGATFTLSAGVAAGLIAAGAVLGAQLPWYAAASLALVPVATLLPLPKSGVWLQAIAASVYGGIPALAACLLSWPEVQQRLGL